MPHQANRSPTPREAAVYRQAVIEGIPRQEVAERMNLKPNTVDRYIRRVEQWTSAQVVALETLLVGHVHLERLEYQWSELMIAWRRSKQDQIVAKATTDKDGNQRVEQTRKSSTGDVRYLEQARRVLADIRSLLGIQQVITLEELSANVDSLTTQQQFALIDQLIAECHRAQAGTAAVPPAHGGAHDRRCA